MKPNNWKENNDTQEGHHVRRQKPYINTQMFIVFYLGTISLISTFIYSERIKVTRYSSSSAALRRNAQYETLGVVPDSDNGTTSNSDIHEKSSNRREGRGDQGELNHDHDHENKNGIVNNSQKDVPYSCASLIPRAQRKILFVNFQSLPSTSTKVSSWAWLDEEYHMSLSLAISMKKQGFDIHVMDRHEFVNEVMGLSNPSNAQTLTSTQGKVRKKAQHKVRKHHQGATSSLDMMKYHRVFYMVSANNDITSNIIDGRHTSELLHWNDLKETIHILEKHDGLLCKFRALIPDLNSNFYYHHDYTRTSLTMVHMQEISSLLHPKQILLPTPYQGNRWGEKVENTIGTPIGYYPVFPHNTNTSMIARQRETKTKSGVVILSWEQLQNANDKTEFGHKCLTLATQLSANGFKMHVIVVDTGYRAPTPSPKLSQFEDSDIIYHSRMSQEEVLNLVANSMFLLHLRPRQEDNDLHSHLAGLNPVMTIALQLGTALLNVLYNLEDQEFLSHDHDLLDTKPYLYNVAFGDRIGLFRAAEQSIQHRFSSHTSLRRGTLEDKACALIEDQSLCACPKVTIGCNSEFYIKKGQVFPSM